MSFSKRRPEINGPVKTGDGIINFHELHKCIATIEMGFSDVWIDAECFVETGNGWIKLIEFLQGIAKIHMERGVSWMYGDSPGKQADSNLVVAGLCGYHAEQV